MNIFETIHTVARKLRNEEQGTALTEFVIVLPLFLVAFGGIISLYDAHETALRTHALASAELWRDVRPIQTSYQAQHMNPAIGAVDAAMHYGGIGQLFSVAAVRDMGDAGAGIYFDSGGKVMLADMIENVGVEPKMTLNGIIGDNTSHTFNLMNDQLLAGEMNMDGFSGVASTLLTQSGARPALAAGIRYGIAASAVRKDFPANRPLLSGQAEAAYTAAAPPMPEERLLAVALTRLEMGTQDPLQDALMPFTMVPKFVSADSIPNSDELEQQSQECAQEAQEWAECRDRWGVFCTKSRPDCGGGSAQQGGRDMLDCLKNPPGGDSANCMN